jgi:hypothetical protein
MIGAALLAGAMAPAARGGAAPAAATPAATSTATLPAPGFADLADLTTAAPLIATGTIARASRVNPKDSPGAPAGTARLLLDVAIESVLVAPGPVPPQLSWLWDAPLDAKGKPPKAKGMKIMAFLATPAAGGQSRLIGRLAQQPWTAGLDASVRQLATAIRSGTVPIVTGVSNGFRATGNVQGESEAQFFLTTADARPITLIVQSRPGEARRVLVARGDIVDDSAAEPVKPETLLWYRLACTLPARLPATAGGKDPALAADWRAAITSLGPCGRTP